MKKYLQLAKSFSSEPLLFLRRGEQIRRLKRLNRELNYKLSKKSDIDSLKGTHALLRVLKHFDTCVSMSDILKADVYVSHDVVPLMAAEKLSEINDAKLFCNVIEVPNFKGRSIPPSWAESVYTLFNQITTAKLEKADLFFTVSEELKQMLKRYNKPVINVPNYKHHEEVDDQGKLREACGLTSNDKIILALSTISCGLENVIEAFDLLPEDYYLVVLGSITPRKYSNRIESLLSKHRILNRFFILDKVNYSELSNYIASADIGVICLDKNIENHYVSLPNRVFDYLSAKIPIVSTNIPAIKNVIEKYDAGIVLQDFSPNKIANACIEIIERRTEYSNKAFSASQALDWSSNEMKILKSFAGLETVAFVGVNNLFNNIRTKKFSEVLASHGHSVKIISFGEVNDQKTNCKNIQYISLDRSQ